MIGIVVAGHIHFSSGLRSAAQAIAGEQQQTAYIDFIAGMSTEQLEIQLRDAVAQCDQGDGVIIFTDIAGGSPCNRASALLMAGANVRVITGTNLPMLVNACLERDGLTLDELTGLLLESGQSSISQVNLLAENTTQHDDDIADDL